MALEGGWELRRRLHEEIDRMQMDCVEALAEPAFGHKTRLRQEHYVANLLERMASSAQRLQGLHEVLVGEEEGEAGNLVHSSGAEQMEEFLSDFYGELKRVKDWHRRQQPGERPLDEVEYEGLLGEALPTEQRLESLFSGEETLGRFLDLHRWHEAYLNLRGATRLDYLAYLGRFDRLLEGDLDQESASFREYVVGLAEYLQDFCRRSQPLANLEGAIGQATERANREWTEQCQSDPLFCAPCAHRFANQAVFQAHLLGRKHRKAVVHPSPALQILINAHIIKQLTAGLLAKQVEASKVNVERKLSRTINERMEDAAALEAGLFEGEEEGEKNGEAGASMPASMMGEGKIYNPLNLPLDWDGKPIPYWLWKLHGLGTAFPCEICGNFEYKGRKAFDQHFTEWRHVYGLKCLGIPSTKHFFQITGIAEAQALWEKLRQQLKQEVYRPDALEECEDAQGNVYSRRTYEDLRRQGLL